MNKPTLSVVMPALNEENNIEAAISSTIKALNKHGIEGELIIVNDGSTDNTKSIIERLLKEYHNIKLINHAIPKGIGYSFWEGAKSSDKDIVVMFPGDNENDADDALIFFNLLNNVDIIIPFIHNVEIRDRARRLISSLYRLIMNVSFGTNINYLNGTVFYRRTILDEIELKNFGFFYQAEILIKLIRKGYLFAEVPNYLGIRGEGKSKALTLKSLMQIINGYLCLVYEIHVRRIESRRKDYRELNKESASYIRREVFESNINHYEEKASV